MKVGVFGCGAMGSIYAALLADSGCEVLAVDANAAHVSAINAKGLRVSGASGDRTVRVEAFLEAPARPVDLLVIAVKAAQVGAAKAARPMLAEASSILTIQNGLGSADAVAEALGAERLIVGVAQGFGASLPTPGHSHHNDMKAIRMGAYAKASKADLKGAVAAFKQAGFDAEAVDDIAAMQWEKLICNAAYSALSALSGMTVGQVMDDRRLGPVSRAAATEAWQTARALGIQLSVPDPVAHVRDFAARMPDAKPSVLLDIEVGRPSEVGHINGAVPREAKKAGLAAPVNATLTALVQALEERNLPPKQETP